MRNVIQIGLHRSAEYAYLSRPDWIDIYRKRHQDKLHRFEILPESFFHDPSEFRYVGIDLCPESVSYVASKYADDYPNARFMCGGVSDRSYTIDNWDQAENLGDYLDINRNIIYPFFDMPTWIDLLRMSALDILAIDVEGYEHFIFNNISSWKVLPKFISLEVHQLRYVIDSERRGLPEYSKDLYPKLKSQILDCGYKITGSEDIVDNRRGWVQFSRDA